MCKLGPCARGAETNFPAVINKLTPRAIAAQYVYYQVVVTAMIWVAADFLKSCYWGSLVFRIRGQNLFIPSSDLDICDDGDQWSGDGDLLDNGVGAWRQRALEELKSGVSRHRMRKILWIPFCAHFSNIMKRIMIVTKKFMMMAHDIIPSQVFHDGSHDFSHVSQRDLWLLISTYDKFKVIVNLYLSA